MKNAEWIELLEQIKKELSDLGVEPIEENNYKVDTILGEYKFRLELEKVDRKFNDISIFGRFQDSSHFADANKEVGSNPHSGKWNTHIYDSNFHSYAFFLNKLANILLERKINYSYNGFQLEIRNNIIEISHKNFKDVSNTYTQDFDSVELDMEYVFLRSKNGNFGQLKFEEGDQGVVFDLFNSEGLHLESLGSFCFTDL